MLALHTDAAQPHQAEGLPRLGSFLRLPPGSEEGSGKSRSSRGAPAFFYGRSVHGGSVAGRTPDTSVRTGSSTHSNAAAAGPAAEDPRLPGVAAAAGGADAAAPLPIATPHAERLQKLLRVLQVNKVCAFRSSSAHAASSRTACLPSLLNLFTSPCRAVFARMAAEDSRAFDAQAGSQGLDRAGLEAGLARLGYDIAPDEAEHLIRQLDTAGTGRVTAAELAAGIIDWTALRVPWLSRQPCIYACSLPHARSALCSCRALWC
jgi:hypothetical protein